MGKLQDAAQRYHLKRFLIWAVMDSLTMWMAYTVTYFARITVTREEYLQSLGFMTFCILVMLASLYLFGVYYRIWARTSGHGVSVIVYAVMVVTPLLMVIDIWMGDPRPLPVSVVLIGNVLALTGFVAFRYRSRLVSGLSWRWRAIWFLEFPEETPAERVLIVGAEEPGQMFAWRLKHRWSESERNKYKVIGFVDDDPDKLGLYVEGTRVLGKRSDIPRLAEIHRIDLIILAVHNIPGPEFRDILSYCEATRARIKVVPDTLAAMETTRATPLLRDVQPEDILGRKVIGRHEDVDFTPVTGKVVLVTGAAGSIGAELGRQMLNYDPSVLILLDNNESGLHDLVIDLGTAQSQTRIVPVLADVTQQNAIEQVFIHHRPQIIFHAAAYKHVPMMELYPYEAVRINIGGTLCVARLARDYAVERFVLISTDKAVSPTSIMGASKRLCERLMHAIAQNNGHDTRFTSVRFGNVLGSRGSVVPIFNRQIDNGGPVTVTHPEMTRYFMTISEAVNLVIHAACLTQGDDLFMLKMGEVVRILDLAERMIRMRGLRPYHDVEIRFTGPRPGEKLHEILQLSYEIPVTTVHPNIVQLVTEQDDFNPARFLAQVDTLIEQCTPDNSTFARDAQLVVTDNGPTFIHSENQCLEQLSRCLATGHALDGEAVRHNGGKVTMN